MFESMGMPCFAVISSETQCLLRPQRKQKPPRSLLLIFLLLLLPIAITLGAPPPSSVSVTLKEGMIQARVPDHLSDPLRAYTFTLFNLMVTDILIVSR